MRSRNIKPAFFKNELLGTYDLAISTLFIGLWCIADKDGILEDRPLRIKAEVFPYRENMDVNGYLTVLERDGFITRYKVAGVGYIHIENFEKHQKPHHTEISKGYPKKDQQDKDEKSKEGLTPLSNGESKVPSRSDLLIPDSLIPDLLIVDDVAAQPPATTNTMPALLDDYQPIAITHDWLPNMPANDFRELCKMRGVKVDPYDPSRLSEFRMHWHGTSQKRTPSQWLNTYVKSLVAQQSLEARQQAKDGPPKTFYELTKEAKERDADKRLTGLASADNATLKALGLLREDGTLKGSSR